MKKIAIISLRAGSKGIPGKNKKNYKEKQNLWLLDLVMF